MGRGKSGISGGSSGIRNMYDLTDDNGTRIGTIFQVNNDTYMESADGRINQLPPARTLDEYLANVQRAGGTASSVSSEQAAQRAQQQAAYRELANQVLDQAYTRDREFVRGSRANRTANRAFARNRRI